MKSWIFLRGVIWRTVLLFALVNFGMAGVDFHSFSKLSVYNRLAPGRERFPFGENPQKAYNLSTYNLEAMFSAHRLTGAEKAQDELRVLVLGDSSVWGSLLRPEETLPGQLNQLNVSACGQRAVFYNLGYPTLSLTKDVMILSDAMRYQPDMIIWLVTLESFPLNRQSESPLVAHNAEQIHLLVEAGILPASALDSGLVTQGVWDRTLIGRRRELADWLRLQLYAGMWAATGIDQDYPASYPPAQRDFKAEDNQFHQNRGPVLTADQLGPGLLEAGYAAAGQTPVLLVNEPVMVSTGENSQLRYNFYYPRWAYDQYRQALRERAARHAWPYVDLWDLAAENDFTNSAIHLTPQGTSRLAQAIADKLQGQLCR